MIYFGGRYRVTVSGFAWKTVDCQGCGCQFVYLLAREGAGAGSSPYYLDNEGAQERARKAAERNLAQLLKFGFDTVPCPDCGIYQDNMVAWLRRRRWGWLNVCGWVVIAATLFLVWIVWVTGPNNPGAATFADLSTSVPAVVGFAIGLVAVAGSWMGRLLYDPNGSAMERIGASPGAHGPYRRQEFERLCQEAAADQRARPSL